MTADRPTTRVWHAALPRAPWTYPAGYERIDVTLRHVPDNPAPTPAGLRPREAHDAEQVPS